MSARTREDGFAAVCRRGFSLIELLVVIIIIGILLSVTLAVATGVREGGRERQTRDVLRGLDVAIESFIRQTGDVPPAVVEAPNPDPGESETVGLPLADGVDMTDDDNIERKAINSIGLFIRAAENEGLGSLFDTIPSSLVERIDGDTLVIAADATVSEPGDAEDRQPGLRTVVDGWGNPMRFVHPAFDGVITEQFLDLGGDGDAGDELTPPGLPVATTLDMAGAPDDPHVLPRSAVPARFFDDGGELDAALFPITQIRRNWLDPRARDEWEEDGLPLPAVGDGDGGFTQGGRPYVYSAGRDGDPSTRTTNDADPAEESPSNIYTQEPRFIPAREPGA